MTGVDRAALEAAARAAGDPDPEVAADGLRLLIDHPSPRTLPALLDALTTAFDPRETIAAEALVDLGAESVPGLTAMLDHGDPGIRWRAARCLTKVAQAGHAETLAGLIKAFHDDSPDVAWVAADGLLALGPGVSVKVLRSVLAEPLTGGTIRALHLYAQEAAPAQVFRPLAAATKGPAVGPSTLMAVDKALRTLEESSPR